MSYQERKIFKQAVENLLPSTGDKFTWRRDFGPTEVWALATAATFLYSFVSTCEYLVLLQDRFWGNVVSFFACDIPQCLFGP